ncbi:MAG: histidine phosphatase family protein [Butyrivibrio sp.]|nr:histidine phosphatase family protein [Butyrivibrio sp.]
MLYIMRHGKTEWNKIEKLQGSTDIPLNEEGIEAAIAAHDKYKDINFDVCYCSPLVRAKKTAELFLEGTETPIIIDDRLKEMSFGELEGVMGYFNDPKCPINNLFTDPANYIPQGNAESIEHMSERALSFLNEIAYPLHNKGKSVLIVCHGALGCSIMSHIRKTPLSDFWSNLMGNCELVKLL